MDDWGDDFFQGSSNDHFDASGANFEYANFEGNNFGFDQMADEQGSGSLQEWDGSYFQLEGDDSAVYIPATWTDGEVDFSDFMGDGDTASEYLTQVNYAGIASKAAKASSY